MDFIPSRDALLVPYGLNFANTLVASPSVYDVTPLEASGVLTLATGYQTAFNVSNDPATRTKGTVAAKDTQKAILKASLRAYAKRVQAAPTVTAQQKLDLGIPVHSTVRTPVPPPGTRPVLSILGIAPLEIRVRIADELTPDRKARPTGAIGAPVYSFVGENPPDDMELWRWEGFASRSEFVIGFNQADANKPVHIRAAWITRRGETGPQSIPLVATVAA